MAPLKLKNSVIDNYGRRKSLNLCFVNADVQMLASIKTFRTFFTERKYLDNEVQIVNAEYPISDSLHDIFSSNGQIEVSCNSLRSMVAEKADERHLSNGEQQDCQVWLAASSPSTVRTHYQKEWEPVGSISRPVTTLGLDPVSKRPSPKQP